MYNLFGLLAFDGLAEHIEFILMSLFQFDFDECNLVFEVGYDHTIPLVEQFPRLGLVCSLQSLHLGLMSLHKVVTLPLLFKSS